MNNKGKRIRKLEKELSVLLAKISRLETRVGELDNAVFPFTVVGTETGRIDNNVDYAEDTADEQLLSDEEENN